MPCWLQAHVSVGKSDSDTIKVVITKVTYSTRLPILCAPSDQHPSCLPCLQLPFQLLRRDRPAKEEEIRHTRGLGRLAHRSGGIADRQNVKAMVERIPDRRLHADVGANPRGNDLVDALVAQLLRKIRVHECRVPILEQVRLVLPRLELVKDRRVPCSAYESLGVCEARHGAG